MTATLVLTGQARPCQSIQLKADPESEAETTEKENADVRNS